MRTNQFAIAAVLTAAALSANAAAPRMEGDHSPFTYEAVGATPSLTFGRAKAATPAAAAEAPKPASPVTRTDTPARAAGTASTPFTYDTLGATPRVERKPAKTEVLAQPAR